MKCDVMSEYRQLLASIARPLSGDKGKLVSKAILSGVIPTFKPGRPAEYADHLSYLEDAQLYALFSKNPWVFETGADLAAVAFEKFKSCEELCYWSNLALSDRRSIPYGTRTVLETARHYVDSILGKFDRSKLILDFGPGASFLLKGKDANLVSKLRSLPECTQEAHHLVLEEILTKMPMYAISCGLVRRERTTVSLDLTKLPLVPGNRFLTVPKDWKTDRPICVEPLGNMLLQKGCGSLIRSKLAKYGFNLDTLPELHAEYARRGSVDGSLATIDLSSASDTVSTELVRFLLPSDWFDFLNQIRCKRTIAPDGSTIRNEKFSSMGNGFTFELESLIFIALSLAVRYHHGERQDVVSSFGDDIIVSTHLAKPLLRLLADCGFTPNQDKTFLDGPFRESCGKDFFRGHLVRPIYFKENPQDEIESLYNMANRIRAVANRLNLGFGCDSRFRRTWLRCVRRIPTHFRCFGPYNSSTSAEVRGLAAHIQNELGPDRSREIGFSWNYRGNSNEYISGVLISDSGWSTRCRDSILAVKVCVFKSVGYHKPTDRDHALCCALAGVGPNGVIPRGSRRSKRVQYASLSMRGSIDLTWL